VTTEQTAQAMKSGNLPVLSTPYMIACMENTALTLLSKYLEANEDSVGIFVEAHHQKASKIGEQITYTATITNVENKKIEFEIHAKNMNNAIIGTCSHTRFI